MNADNADQRKKNMARKKDIDTPKTQEELTREHFEREQEAYRKRTGEPSNYEMGAAVTCTPVEEEAVTTEGTESTEAETALAEGEG